MYLKPPEPTSLGLLSYKYGTKPSSNLQAALRIMDKHAGCIDTTKVMKTGCYIKTVKVFILLVLGLE